MPGFQDYGKSIYEQGGQQATEKQNFITSEADIPATARFPDIRFVVGTRAAERHSGNVSVCRVGRNTQQLELSTGKLLVFGMLKFKSGSMQSAPKELSDYFYSLRKGNSSRDHSANCAPV